MAFFAQDRDRGDRVTADGCPQLALLEGCPSGLDVCLPASATGDKLLGHQELDEILDYRPVPPAAYRQVQPFQRAAPGAVGAGDLFPCI